MNQAINLINEMIKESADRLHIYTTGALPKDIRDDMKILVDFVKSLSSLPSDTQWIDRLNNLKNRTDRDYEFAGESQRSYDKGQIDILEDLLRS